MNNRQIIQLFNYLMIQILIKVKNSVMIFTANNSIKSNNNIISTEKDN